MPLFPHSPDQVLHRLGLRVIQPRRRLVEKEQLGPGRQGDADFQEPLLSVGEVARERLLLPPQADEIQDLLGPSRASPPPRRRFRLVLKRASRSVSLSCRWWPVRMLSRTERSGKREVI